MSRSYKLKYSFDTEVGQFTLEDVVNDSIGLTDAVMVVSIVREPPVGISYVLLSHDGETDEELTAKEMFKVWMMLGNKLSDDGQLNDSNKELVDTFKEICQSTVYHQKKDTQSH